MNARNVGLVIGKNAARILYHASVTPTAMVLGGALGAVGGAIGGAIQGTALSVQGGLAIDAWFNEKIKTAPAPKVKREARTFEHAAKAAA